MARLLALLLLYQAGYEVGRFISLEKLIAESRETYYESLEASTNGWHSGEHGVSDDYIRDILTDLRKKGVVRPLSRGRSASWERLNTDF